MPSTGAAPALVAPGPAAVPVAALPVLGIPVHPLPRATALARCAAAIAGRGGGGPPLQVVTLNPEMVMAARRLPDLAQIIGRAGLVIPDGAGIAWASRRLGRPVPERIPGVELLDELAARAVAANWRLFLLGSGPGVAAAAAAALERAHPGLRVAGTAAGSPDAAEAPALVQAIRAARADLLAVAFGVPEQERWLARHLAATGAGVGIGVGGSLDYLAGRVPRAPLWLRSHGLEWAYRLLRQPWRLPRMVRGSAFFWQVWRSRPR